jgi:hypothetical protein
MAKRKEEWLKIYGAGDGRLQTVRKANILTKGDKL